MLPLTSLAPSDHMQLSGKNSTIDSRLAKLLRQTRLFYLTALLIGVTLVFSSMLANEHNFKVCSLVSFPLSYLCCSKA